MQLFCHPGATADGPAALVRLCLAAGVAAASACAVTSPMSSPGDGVADIARPVALAASWSDVSETAMANATDIWNHFSAKPFPVIQQLLSNQAGYLDDLIRNPGDFQTVLSQIQANVAAVFGTAAADGTPAHPGAQFGPFLPAGGPTDTLYESIDGVVKTTGTGLFGEDSPFPLFLTHQHVFSLLNADLPAILPILGLDDSNLPLAEQVYEFLGSPASGIVIGEIGMMLGPLLQFNDDLTAIFDEVSGDSPDWDAAWQLSMDMPADVGNAFLNGYGPVDLIPLLNQLGITLPPLDVQGIATATVTSLTMVLGGLLSPGGSLFDGLGIGADVESALGPGSFDLAGVAVGPIASMIELGQAVAVALGWDGIGSPIEIADGLL